MTIAVLSAGAGNLGSVSNALDVLSIPFVTIGRPEELRNADALILPGVGSFGAVMERLSRAELVEPVIDYIGSGRPFLGICVGMQILFPSSEESPTIAGLGVIPGRVRKFLVGKVPQIGWNMVNSRLSAVLLSGYYYFVHSYYVAPESPEIVVGEADYHTPFVAVIARENIVATQFHPEKSGELGLRFLQAWVRSC